MLQGTRCIGGVTEIMPAVRHGEGWEGEQHVMQSRSIGDQDNPLVPVHSRMRAFDRDLIRGGHYGQRPCVPR
jgi:hypothetical protein